MASIQPIYSCFPSSPEIILGVPIMTYIVTEMEEFRCVYFDIFRSHNLLQWL